jgi:hypothetical protein
VYELFLTRGGESITLEDLVLDAIGESDLPADRHDLRFGQTSDGEIYVITKQDGWIRRLGEIATTTVLPGDYNGNGIVDAGDYTVWRDTMGQSGSGLAADGNGDNRVDLEDYGVWLTNFGQTVANGSSAITPSIPAPEPAGAMLWLLGLVVAARRIRNCRTM